MKWWKKFINALTTYQSPKKENEKKKEEYKKVKSRTNEGRYVADDSDTPENKVYTRKKKKNKK